MTTSECTEEVVTVGREESLAGLHSQLSAAISITSQISVVLKETI